MSYAYHTTDVFTDKPFGGNQLAVIPDARGLSDDDMASITREFNYSETTFVFPPDDPANTRRVRIFTPGSELPFAGHPTVGTAIVLAATGEIPMDGDETRIVFEEGVGPVRVTIRSENGRPAFAQLTAAKVPEKGPGTYDNGRVAAALSLDQSDIATDNDHLIEGWSVGVPFLFVPLRSIDALNRSRVRMDEFERTLKDAWSPDVFVFVADDLASGRATIHARMFAPLLNVPEDPATGSAVAAFGGYFASRARSDGTLRATVHQGVQMGRPSRLELEVDRVGGLVAEVRVGGAAVMVSSGTLHVP